MKQDKYEAMLIASKLRNRCRNYSSAYSFIKSFANLSVGNIYRLGEAKNGVLRVGNRNYALSDLIEVARDEGFNMYCKNIKGSAQWNLERVS